jgi:glycerol uptake facilitator protein
VTLGWGFAVFMAAYVAFRSGAHLNPAVTLGIAIFKDVFAAGVPVTLHTGLVYVIGQLLGAFTGAFVTFIAFYQHFQQVEPADSLGIFATGPAIRHPLWNTATEVIGTFFLVLWILISGYTPTGLGPLGVAIVVIVIGMGMGGPTGYAINPARDLGPRVAHALMPLRHKGGSDWSYAWIPVVGPLMGGALAALAAGAL